MNQVQKLICICARGREIVKCIVCGYSTYGRIYKKCQSHPMRRYHADILACPMCSAANLKAIKATTI